MAVSREFLRGEEEGKRRAGTCRLFSAALRINFAKNLSISAVILNLRRISAFELLRCAQKDRYVIGMDIIRVYLCSFAVPL
jgi:hypothetical protein